MARITHESEEEEVDDFLQALQNHNNLDGLDYDEEMQLPEESTFTETSSQSSYSEDPQFLTKN